MHPKSLKNNVLCDIHLGYYFIIQDMYFYFYLQLPVQLLVVFFYRERSISTLYLFS